ncbi:hypothetical protein Tco_0504738 [Tanacetum coccineum]
MHAKQNDPIAKDKKVNIAPIDYATLNKLSEHFVPQKHLFAKQKIWLPISKPVSKTPLVQSEPVPKEIPRELPTISLIKNSFNNMRSLVNDFNKVITVRTKVTGQNEGTWSMEKSYQDEYNECVNLKAELSKKNAVVEKADAPEFQAFFEINDLKAQLKAKNNSISKLKDHIATLKGKSVSEGDKSENISKVIAPGMYKLDLEPLSPKLLKNREAHIDYLKHTQENADTLREIVKKATALRPLDSDIDFAFTPIYKNKKVRFTEPRTSSSKTQKQVDSCKTKDTNKTLLPSTGVISSTSASGSKPPGNTKKNRISRPTSSNKKNKVEDHLRSIKSILNKKNRVSEPVCNVNVKHSILNVNSELICATCNECMFDAIHDLCVLDYLNDVNVRGKPKSIKSKKNKVWKPTGKVFTNVGYSWKPTGRTFTIDGNTYPLTRITSTTIVPPKKPLSTTVVKKTVPKSNNSGKLKDITNIGSSSKSKSVESKISNNSEPKKHWGSNVSTSPSSSRVYFRSFKSSSGTVRFGNDHVAEIKGYGDYKIGNVTIS